MSIEEAKRAAATAAVRELPLQGVIGLGTGSTARYFIEQVGALVRGGRSYRGVPTSEESRAQAAREGIPLLGDGEPWEIAVTVDGADEVDPTLDLIKGGGGAHTREKIVSYASARTVIVVDEEKLSPRLGVRRSVPVEVLPFGHAATMRRLERYGGVTLRMASRAGAPAPFRTDAMNLVFDVACGPIADARGLDAALREIPGVVATGLFVGRADVVIVADGAGAVRRLTRPGS